MSIAVIRPGIEVRTLHRFLTLGTSGSTKTTMIPVLAGQDVWVDKIKIRRRLDLMKALQESPGGKTHCSGIRRLHATGAGLLLWIA
jgi:hypothetical protein